MNPDFATRLRCPARDCTRGPLTITARVSETIPYRTGPLEEVREGDLHCATCARRYPISEYVPSFEALFPPELLTEAEFWSQLYGFMWEQGYAGWFDLRAPLAPLIMQGITALDPYSAAGLERGGMHTILEAHPLIRDARWVLDVGCGTGWSSLYLARQNHNVCGFDPSAANMGLAKRYAIGQGEYIEYLGAAAGFLAFAPASFDAIFALHAIHHVPQLRDEMKIMCEWLRDGGGIAVDEHIRNDPWLEKLAGQLDAWAQAEVYPRYRTLSPDVMQRLPQAGHSTLEAMGSDEVIPALLDNFAVESFSARYMSLDGFSLIYYLSRDQDEQGYHYCANVVDRIYRSLVALAPEGAEYITLIGRKGPADKPESAELAQQALLVSKGPHRAEDDVRALGGALAITETELAALHADLDARSSGASQAQTELGALRNYVSGLQTNVGAKNRYIEELERSLAAKNEHIARLEALVRRQQRVLDSPPGRVAQRFARRG